MNTVSYASTCKPHECDTSTKLLNQQPVWMATSRTDCRPNLYDYLKKKQYTWKAKTEER